MLGAVVPTCNSSNSVGRDQEEHSSKPAKAKNSQGPISTNKSYMYMVMHICHPSYTGSINRRINESDQPRHKHETLFKNT
jgi:hypothetical protein